MIECDLRPKEITLGKLGKHYPRIEAFLLFRAGLRRWKSLEKYRSWRGSRLCRNRGRQKKSIHGLPDHTTTRILVIYRKTSHGSTHHSLGNVWTIAHGSDDGSGGREQACSFQSQGTTEPPIHASAAERTGDKMGL